MPRPSRESRRGDGGDPEPDESEINRIVDERMAKPGVGVPIEVVLRETLARGDGGAEWSAPRAI
ncbi:hypothetical protein GCM10022245_40890 [Streptomyces mayteni]